MTDNSFVYEAARENEEVSEAAEENGNSLTGFETVGENEIPSDDAIFETAGENEVSSDDEEETAEIADIRTDRASFGSESPMFMYSLMGIAPHENNSDDLQFHPEHNDSDDLQFYSEYSVKLGIKLDGDENRELIMAIDRWLGTPFKMGGCSTSGIDCSCLVREIFKDVYGIELNRTSRSIYYDDAIPVKKKDLQEGDIICFKIRGRRISHIGIYLKDDKFVHSSLSKGVRINDLKQKYFRKRFFSGGRVKGMDISRK